MLIKNNFIPLLERSGCQLYGKLSLHAFSFDSSYSKSNCIIRFVKSDHVSFFDNVVAFDRVAFIITAAWGYFTLLSQ